MRQHLPELKTLRQLVGVGAKSKCPLQGIADALIADGYTSLDAQAKALGIHRATTWTIIRAKHKLGRLNPKTTDRMLANPNLPPSVRSVLETYVSERIKKQNIGRSEQDKAEEMFLVGTQGKTDRACFATKSKRSESADLEARRNTGSTNICGM